jgi:ERCC4-type nuclease
MTHIVIDDRERFVTPFLTESAKDTNVSYEIKRIMVGDYVIMNNGAIVAIIERKTWRDLAASFRDGRKENLEKMLTLREQTNCTLYYFIEGNAWPDPNGVCSRMPYKNMIAHLDHVAIRDNIHTIFVKTPETMAQRLFALAKNCATIRPRFTEMIKQLNNAAAKNNGLNDDGTNNTNDRTNDNETNNTNGSNNNGEIDRSNNGTNEVNNATNPQLLNLLNQKPTADKTNLNILHQLDGIGEYAAYVLDTNGITLAHFNRETPEKLREILVECSKNTGRNQVFNELIISRIISNKKYFTKEPEITAPTYLRDRAKKHLKLIANIGGISEKTAAIILIAVPFYDIFNDPAVLMRLSAVQKTEKTKLGIKLAARIIHYFGLARTE